MTRTVIYTRVSSAKQGAGFSLGTQLDGCRKWCHDRGYLVVGEFSDQFTGTVMERPGLIDLLDVVERGGVDVVVAWDLDRLLGRVELPQVITRHRITSVGVRIEYALDGSDHDPTASDSHLKDLLMSIKAWGAEDDNRKRSEAARRGQRGRVDQGHVMISGTGAPYGFDYVPGPKAGKLVVNETEAAVVRDIYDWLVVEGLSTHAIAQRLHDLRVSTRGDLRRDAHRKVNKETGRTVWHPSTVKKILNSPVYRGEWTYGMTRRIKRRDLIKPNGDTYKTLFTNVPVDPSEWIRVRVPAIVDDATWHRGQERLAENKRFAKPPKRPYLLRSMIFCATCGTRWGGAQQYYRCGYNGGNATKPWARACSSKRIPVDALDAAVWDHVTGYLLHPDRLMTDVERRRHEETAERGKYEHERRAVDAELATIDRQLSALLTQALDGFPAAVIDAKRRELIEKRDRLTEDRRRLDTRSTQVTITPDIESMLRELSKTYAQALPIMTFEEKRQLLRILRVRVEVTDREEVRISGILSGAILTIPSR